jgi:hypothetical protein
MSSEFVGVGRSFQYECRWFSVLCETFYGCVPHPYLTRENGRQSPNIRRSRCELFVALIRVPYVIKSVVMVRRFINGAKTPLSTTPLVVNWILP